MEFYSSSRAMCKTNSVYCTCLCRRKRHRDIEAAIHPSLLGIYCIKHRLVNSGHEQGKKSQFREPHMRLCPQSFEHPAGLGKDFPVLSAGLPGQLTNLREPDKKSAKLKHLFYLLRKSACV